MASSGIAQGYLANIRSLVERARETDYVMPIWLPYLPLLIVLASMFGIFIVLAASEAKPVWEIRHGEPGFAVGEYSRDNVEFALDIGAIFLFLAMLIAGLIVQAYVVYKWIDRRNKHFARTHALYENIVEYLEALGIQEPEIAQMRSIVQEMRYREPHRSPVLWLILIIIPVTIVSLIAQLYVYHFLTRDYYEHEVREQMFYRQLSELLKRHGVYLEPPEQTVPDRNTVLYIILSIVTLGLFFLYWVYVMTEDPNRHFTAHSGVEQNLIRALESLAAPTA
ncbi:DUF4234 domain-containing protein [Hyperthermus butylicus]|uniref:DUF4234 domain-containing protein n=1 Tax=Hyperthermus butylicus TaxID=54248 RepID=UPI00064ED5D0|nr:DUF4234 domain-containing protein [Hyperthermus butylicus]